MVNLETLTTVARLEQNQQLDDRLNTGHQPVDRSQPACRLPTSRKPISWCSSFDHKNDLTATDKPAAAAAPTGKESTPSLLFWCSIG